MTNESPALLTRDTHSHWLLLRTFTVLRWLAVAGQIAALIVAYSHFDLRFDQGPVYMAIAAAIIANLISISIFPESRRLSERQALGILLFDMAQLSVLLYFTGGLHNPFALLIIVPVTISATALSLRSTLTLVVLAIAMATVLALYHVPLRTGVGYNLQMPRIFVFGFWVSLVIGTIFLAVYARRISSEIHSMSEALVATQMALSREQKLTDLGGVVAAAAHELGTPLATIKLASAELVEDLADHPEQRDDARLISEQTDRCREILHSMGRAGKDDAHMRTTPISALLSEAAEPHLGRGKDVLFDISALDGGGDEPVVWRRPGITHGLRNLIQNAVDFAETTVWIEARWSEAEIRLGIVDDGDGYPSHLLGRLGDPFLRRRRGAGQSARRPEYDGMGLGLFIAKTLLERSGARLTFANASDPFLNEDEKPVRCGAMVEVVWPRGHGDLEAPQSRAALGDNPQITG